MCRVGKAEDRQWRVAKVRGQEWKDKEKGAQNLCFTAQLWERQGGNEGPELHSWRNV